MIYLSRIVRQTHLPATARMPAGQMRFKALRRPLARFGAGVAVWDQKMPSGHPRATEWHLWAILALGHPAAHDLG
jgi:hypothetical protein